MVRRVKGSAVGICNKWGSTTQAIVCSGTTRLESVAIFFGHASGKKPFERARCCKAWLIVVRQCPESMLHDASPKTFAIPESHNFHGEKVLLLQLESCTKKAVHLPDSLTGPRPGSRESIYFREYTFSDALNLPSSLKTMCSVHSGPV